MLGFRGNDIDTSELRFKVAMYVCQLRSTANALYLHDYATKQILEAFHVKGKKLSAEIASTVCYRTGLPTGFMPSLTVHDGGKDMGITNLMISTGCNALATDAFAILILERLDVVMEERRRSN